jgi:Fe2+ transport system protein A
MAPRVRVVYIMPGLDQVQEGKKVTVIEINGGRSVRQGLAEMGVHPGDIVGIIRSSVFGGPLLIDIRDNKIAIGRSVAQKIEVEVVD